MKVSPVEEYGLRCLIQLAKQAGGHPVTIRQIAEAEGLSTAYVGKLMFLLHKAQLVQATRGVQGGYVLTKGPTELTLDDVFKALDQNDLDDVCDKFTGNESACVHVSACVLKRILGGLNEHIGIYLRKITLQDLIPAAMPVQKEI